jgi:hypothetical protein
MADIHEGGCHCGAVRYRVLSNPMLAGVCHCTSCQRRSGSAFGISAYLAQSQHLCHETKLLQNARWARQM